MGKIIKVKVGYLTIVRQHIKWCFKLYTEWILHIIETSAFNICKSEQKNKHEIKIYEIVIQEKKWTTNCVTQTKRKEKMFFFGSRIGVYVECSCRELLIDPKCWKIIEMVEKKLLPIKEWRHWLILYIDRDGQENKSELTVESFLKDTEKFYSLTFGKTNSNSIHEEKNVDEQWKKVPSFPKWLGHRFTINIIGSRNPKWFNGFIQVYLLGKSKWTLLYWMQHSKAHIESKIGYRIKREERTKRKERKAI